MSIQTSFNLRFKHTLAGFKFFADETCDDRAELKAVFQRLNSQPVRAAQLEIDLDSARIMPDLSSLKGAKSFSLEDHTEALVATICESMNVGQEAFMNERLGFYDVHNNRGEPMFMGNTFPNGCRYLVWRNEESAFLFDTTVVFFEQLFTFLVLGSTMEYFNFTDDEVNNDDRDAVQKRLQSALIDLGMWPCDDANEPFPDLLDDIDTLPQRVSDALARYAAMTLQPA